MQLETDELRRDIQYLKEKFEEFEKENGNSDAIRSELEKAALEPLLIQNGHSKNHVNDDTDSAVHEKPPAKEIPPQKPPEKSEKPFVTDALRTINNVKKEVSDLEERIKYYKPSTGDRVNKQFNEKIIRYRIKIDLVDSKGNQTIRQAKREVLDYISQIQAILKAR